MHAVIEMPQYLRAVHQAGMTEEEREAIILMIAKNPLIGDVIQGTGGC